MTTSVSYLASAGDQTYSQNAWDYISLNSRKALIIDAASNIGISAGAIAGAMAEEATAYYDRQTFDDLLDQYALSGIDPTTASASLNVALAAGAVGLTACEQ